MELIIESRRFVSFLKAISLSGAISKVGISLTPGGVESIVDESKQILAKSWFSNDFFIEYNIEEPVRVGIDCSQLINLLKVASEDKMRISLEGESITIEGEKTEISVPTLVVEDSNVPLEFHPCDFGEVPVPQGKPIDSRLPLYSYTKIGVISGAQIDPLKMDKVALEVRDGRFILTQENEAGVRISKLVSEAVNNPKDGTKVYINSNYLKETMKSVISGEAYIAIGYDSEGKTPLPVIVCDKTADWRCTYVIAPILES